MNTTQSPDISIMTASFDAMLLDVAEKGANIRHQTEPAVLARFNADVFNYDPFILKALGAEVECTTELRPVRNRQAGNGLANVGEVDIAGRKVVLQRTEIDLRDLPEGVPSPLPEGLGRIVTYSALAVSADYYDQQHSRSRNAV